MVIHRKFTPSTYSTVASRLIGISTTPVNRLDGGRISATPHRMESPRQFAAPPISPLRGKCALLI